MSKPNVSSKLYSKLPEFYRYYDSQQINDHPLKKLLQVLGAGFDAMEDAIKGVEDIYDLDNCPVEFIPLIVEQAGFKFPYALEDSEHRTLVKALPQLYKTKGTAKSFTYLAREIFGSSVSIAVKRAEYVEGMSVSEWRKIYIELTANTEQLNLDTKEEYFRKFAELVRPVNTQLVMYLSTFFDDVYDRNKRDDSYSFDIITEDNGNDAYNTSKRVDASTSTVAHNTNKCYLDNTYYTTDGLFYTDDIQQDGTLAY